MKVNAKRMAEILLFFGVMALTFYTFFYQQNPLQILAAVRQIRISYAVTAFLLGILFICLEGSMIWYLLHGLGSSCSLPRCIQYSFIGFFYSGITPSATGGQPMQLYYMQKDGNHTADSTVVLMTVALAYKLVLVLIGIGIMVFWHNSLRSYLKHYYFLYLIGIGLNILLVMVIGAVMLCPEIIRHIALTIDNLLVRFGILKANTTRLGQVEQFIENYRCAVAFLRHNRPKIFVVVCMTFLQRSTVFILTGIVYKGFGLYTTPVYTVILLQACVYIAVDMLPVPGAQGITELMYRAVFIPVFGAKFLIPSMMVCRAMNFYVLLIISMFVAIWRHSTQFRSTWVLTNKK